MILLDADSSIAAQEIIILIPALGCVTFIGFEIVCQAEWFDYHSLGFLFPVPLLALQSAIPPSSIATYVLSTRISGSSDG